MHRADQQQFGVLEIEPMPRFEQRVNSLALDECAGENRPEKRRVRPRREPLHIGGQRKIEELFFWEADLGERLGGALRINQQHRRQIVLLQHLLTADA